MSYEGQVHHPHAIGGPPNAHLIDRAPAGESSYIPAGLELVQAHWYTRHGERSPVRKRLAGMGDIPAIFPLCAVGRQFKNAVLRYDSVSADAGEDEGVGSRSFEGAIDNDGRAFQSDLNGSWEGAAGRTLKKSLMSVRRLTEEQGQGNEAVRGTLSDCYWGELTDLGRESTLALGSRLRSLYVDQLQFLPSVLPDVPVDRSVVTFRSTGMPRTIESLHQIVQGLFPEREGAVEYTVRNPQDESLYPNSLCARMRLLDRASAKEAAEKYNPSLAELDPLIKKYTGGTVSIDSKPQASGILDTIYVARAHGIKTPAEFQDLKVLRTLETAVVHEWFDGYANCEFKRLAMGRLLGDLRAAMEKKAADPHERKEKLRLAIYSCHDTSLSGILNSLDVFDGRWPPFTSHIGFELLRSSSAPAPSFLSSLAPGLLQSKQVQARGDSHFVRMRYNGRPMQIPACAPQGLHLEGHPDVCTLQGFRNAVQGVEMTGREWEKGCAVSDVVTK